MDKKEQVKEYLRDHPNEQTAVIADALGVSRRTVRRARQEAREATGMPRILLFDVETAPMECYIWSLFQKGPIHEQNIVKDWSVLCWAAKWLYDSRVYHATVTTAEATERNDTSILESMWSLMDEADIVIAHNAAKFDVRKMNLRFLKAHLPPPKPYQVVDTLKQAQKFFAASSHKLDSLAAFLNIARKGESNFSLWKRSVTGDSNALAELTEYCMQDVVVLEELYTKLRPWIKSHPNMGLYIDTDKTVCPNCGSDNLNWQGYYYTNSGKYRAFRCECGAVGRSRHSDVSESKSKTLVVPTAR